MRKISDFDKQWILFFCRLQSVLQSDDSGRRESLDKNIESRITLSISGRPPVQLDELHVERMDGFGRKKCEGRREKVEKEAYSHWRGPDI